MPSSVNVPQRFQARTLNGYEAVTESAGKAALAARDLVSGTIRSLVLVGPTGVGKSHLAAGVVAAITEREDAIYEEKKSDAAQTDFAYWPTVPVYPEWLNVADAIVSLKLEMDAPLDDREMGSRVRRLRTHRALVVLDDLGRERQSDWTGEVVYALVNARYEAELPTLVTTNLTAAELAASPYWPAVSRLAEDGALVKIEAPDRRLA